MALLNKGTVIALAEETVIGEGKATAYVAGDVVSFNSDSGMTVATSLLERDVLNGDFVMCPSISGIDSTSGNLNVDLGILPVTGTEAGKLNGHLIFKSGLGRYVEQGADVDLVGYTILEEVNSVANPTGYDLYVLSKPSDARVTLSAKEYLGGSGNTIESKGLVVDSMSFDFSAGNIVKVSNSLSGVGYTTATGETPLTSLGCSGIPFVTKNAVLKLGGVTLNASNVSLSITNTVVDRSFITGTGISDKVVVAKAIELTYTLDLDTAEMAFFDKMKNNNTGEIFIGLTTTSSDVAYIYLPKVNFTNVTKNDDGGVLTLSVTSGCFNSDTTDEAIYIASKKA